MKGYASPDYPDVHREWVRREWVSGSQGLVNQHSPDGAMGVPRLFDNAGLNSCILLPDVPHAVCQDANIEKVPAPQPVPVPEVPTLKAADVAFGVVAGAGIAAVAAMILL